MTQSVVATRMHFQLAFFMQGLDPRSRDSQFRRKQPVEAKAQGEVSRKLDLKRGPAACALHYLLPNNGIGRPIDALSVSPQSIDIELLKPYPIPIAVLQRG